MFTLCQLLKTLFLTGILLTLFNMPSFSAEIRDVSFSDRVEINGVALRLNGLAVLKWAMLFDVYAGAFYLPENVPGAQWDNDGPKKLELSYFREIEAKGFAEASDKILKENLSAGAYEQLADRLATFYGFFQNVKPGDRYSLNYLPGIGTELRLNGNLMGSVPGHDFAVAYFGIWLGDNPINKQFRNKLLSDR